MSAQQLIIQRLKKCANSLEAIEDEDENLDFEALDEYVVEVEREITDLVEQSQNDDEEDDEESDEVA